MTTRDRIVQLADRLQRQRGYAGWSYADIAEEIGIRRASIHHHFPTKSALLGAVIGKSVEDAMRFGTAHEEARARERFLAFLDTYARLLDTQTICFCGAISVDLPGLSDDVRPAALGYLTLLRSWLVGVFTEGQQSGEVRATAAPDAQAQLTMAALQGAIQHARALNDPAPLDSVITQLRHLLLETP